MSPDVESRDYMLESKARLQSLLSRGDGSAKHYQLRCAALGLDETSGACRSSKKSKACLLGNCEGQ
jgi:hypothetical protein